MDRKPEAVLKAELVKAAQLVEVGATYVHHKNLDQTYTVQGFALLAESGKAARVSVVYKANYGEGFTFVRPLSEWIEKIGDEHRFRKV